MKHPPSLVESKIPAHLPKPLDDKWPKVHDEAERMKMIHFKSKVEKKILKEPRQGNLTSEWQWYKNVNNIWVKIMNIVFAWLKTSGVEKLQVFSNRINIALYWKAYVKVEASVLKFGVPFVPWISVFGLRLPWLLRCNLTNWEPLSPDRERNKKPFDKDVFFGKSLPAHCLFLRQYHVSGLKMSSLTFSSLYGITVNLNSFETKNILSIPHLNSSSYECVMEKSEFSCCGLARASMGFTEEKTFFCMCKEEKFILVVIKVATFMCSKIFFSCA